MPRRLRRAVGRRLPRPIPAPRGDSVRAASDSPPRLVPGPAVRHDPALDAMPSVVVLLPHLAVDRMSGGPNTVFQVTERLAARGHKVRYVACSGPLDADHDRLRGHLADVTGLGSTFDVEFHERSAPGAVLEVGARDVAIATWWPTAYVARDVMREAGRPEFLYVVQDFEPAFYAWSTRYALAAATYDMPIRAVVNETTLLAHLRETSRPDAPFHDPTRAVAFMPAVDRSVFVPGDRGGSERTLAFYARPNRPRNLYELGIAALRDAIERGAFDEERWTFVAIGELDSPVQLPAGHVLRPMPGLSYRAYAALLSRADVLLSLMLSPHTSYPPLEMAAAGGLVVTTEFGAKTREALAAISPAIIGVPAEVGSVSSALADAAGRIRQPEALQARPASVALPGTWDEALADVVPWVEAAIEASRRA